MLLTFFCRPSFVSETHENKVLVSNKNPIKYKMMSLGHVSTHVLSYHHFFFRLILSSTPREHMSCAEQVSEASPPPKSL